MQALQSHTCPCGKPMFEDLSRCPMCSQQRRSTIDQTYGLDVQKSLTPPPSQPSSPRKSTELALPASSSHRPKREVHARNALDAAFAFSFEQHDDDDDDDDEPERGSAGRDIFPPRLYRSGSDRRRKGSLSRSSSESASSGQDVSPERSRKSPVPSEFRTAPRATSSAASTPSGSADAPMAAAFARLSRKDAAKEEGRKKDLSARMFEGAA